jgi:hypothetical protein
MNNQIAAGAGAVRKLNDQIPGEGGMNDRGPIPIPRENRNAEKADPILLKF